MTKPRFRVSVLGLGWIATKVHLPYLQQRGDVKVVATYDPVPERVEAAKHAFSLPSTADIDAFFDVASDVVVICTPPSTHAALAARSLEGDRHVLCEKPLTLTSAYATSLAHLARNQNRLLFCCMTNRFRTDIAQVAQVLTAGRIGEPRYVRAEWLRSRGIPGSVGAIEAGVVWDLGSHMIDLVLWLTNWGMPDNVQGIELGLASDTGTDNATWHKSIELSNSNTATDTAVVSLAFPGQRAAQINVSWCSHLPRDRTSLLILGTEGSLRLNTVFGWSTDRDALPGPALQVSDLDTSSWQTLMDEQDTSRGEYTKQLDVFFEALETGTDVSAYLDGTVLATAVTARAAEALRQRDNVLA